MAKLTTQVGGTMVNDFEFGYGHNAIITTLNKTPSVSSSDRCSDTYRLAIVLQESPGSPEFRLGWLWTVR